jgi:phage shock protein C
MSSTELSSTLTARDTAPMAMLSDARRSLSAQGLVRPRRGRIVAGVAAGVARRYGVSPWLVRLLFVASLLLPGPQFVIYIALWILMPKEPRSG